MKPALVVALVFLATFKISSQETGIDLTVIPSAVIPLGPLTVSGVLPYAVGAGASLSGDWEPPFADYLRLGATIGYARIPTLTADTLTMVRIGATVSLPLAVAGPLSLDLGLGGGYSLGLYDDALGSNAWVEARTSLNMRLSGSVGLGLGAAYRETPGLYRGVDAFLSLRLTPSAPALSPKLEIRGIELHPVFPVFYKYYDSNPMGSVTIVNSEAADIYDIRVSVFIKSYMDSPKTYSAAAKLYKGQSIELPLHALFNQNVLGVTEGTKASMDIEISYRRGKDELQKRQTVGLEVLYRNALSWDDDRKAASFVTAKDPIILAYSKNIAGSVREGDPSGFNLPFRQAMALFESLSIYGMNYVIDPASSYASLSANALALDYLQFPSQSLSYHAGDCDDLSVLYCALLEASGIETAFITVPGHIYAAFNPGIAPDQASRYFQHADDYLVKDGRLWIPLEITMIHDGFIKAWQEGSRQWREALPKDQAALYPVREAWRLFEPTASIEDARVINPDRGRIMARYEESWKRFVSREIAEREASLKASLSKRDDPSNRNRLGVLYARYSLYDLAEAQFAAGAKSQDLACLINSANIRFLRGDFLNALSGYQRALSLEATNVAALLGAARSEFERENYASAKAFYKSLEAISPETALAYAYIIQASSAESRANSTSDRIRMEWGE